MIISSQICVSKLQRVFTLGDGCWLPITVVLWQHPKSLGDRQSTWNFLKLGQESDRAKPGPDQGCSEHRSCQGFLWEFLWISWWPPAPCPYDEQNDTRKLHSKIHDKILAKYKILAKSTRVVKTALQNPLSLVTQRARRCISMPRGKTSRETIFAAQLPRTYPHREVNLKEEVKPSLMGERQAGKHFQRQLWRG